MTRPSRDTTAPPSHEDTDTVDAHTHLLPPRLARRVRAVFDTHLPGEVVYPLDDEAVFDDHATAGVRTIWNLPYAHAPGVAAWLNPGIAEHTAHLAPVAAARGIRIVTGCTVHPGDDDPLATVDRALEAGARVLKLHTSVGGFGLDDPRFVALWPTLAERRVPVTVHAGRHVAGVHDGPGLEEVDRVATAHPDLRLIVAHAALPDVGATLQLLDRHPQVHADLTPVLARLPALTAAQLRRHADRLLFGSDAPNTGMRLPVQVAAWRAELGDDPAVAAAVMGGTAQRLIADVEV